MLDCRKEALESWQDYLYRYSLIKTDYRIKVIWQREDNQQNKIKRH